VPDRFTSVFSSGPDEPEGDERLEEDIAPVWFGPPPDELGDVAPLSLVIARSENAVVALTHATVYSTGVSFGLRTEARGLREQEVQRLMHEQYAFAVDEEPPPGFLRVGFELADGQRVSNLGRDRRLMNPETDPEVPVLMQQGGGGGSEGAGRLSQSADYWLWPLPDVRLRVFVEWPALDIPLSHVDLDAESLREAASRSRSLWDE